MVEGEESQHCSPVAFTAELRPRDTGTSGFVAFMVPPEEVCSYSSSIRQAILEVWEIEIKKMAAY